MNINCVILLVVCGWVSSVFSSQPQRQLTDEDLASSPLIQHLLNRVDILEQLGAKQAVELLAMKSELSEQRSYTKKLRSKLYAKDKMIQRLLSEIEIPTESLKNGAMKHADTALGSDESEEFTKQKTPVQEQGNRIRRADNTMPVAFFATLTHDVKHVYNVRTLIFDHVETNVGNAYNPVNGDFTAPKSGIYVFHTTIMSIQNGTTIAFMSVNDHIKSSLYMHERTSLSDMASQTMVLVLDQGDTVAIKGRGGDTYYGDSGSYTTFSGFLLQATAPNTGGTQVVG